MQNEHPIRSNGSCLFTITQVQQGARSWLISSQSIFFGLTVVEVFEAVRCIPKSIAKSTYHFVWMEIRGSQSFFFHYDRCTVSQFQI